MKKLFAVSGFLLFVLVSCNSQEYKYLDIGSGLSGVSSSSGIDRPVTVSIIYDNYVHSAGFTADWGFSVLITGLSREILFDAGTNPEIFESNFSKMNLDASEVDYVVISHEHGDHTAGLPGFIKMKSNIPVIIPNSFSARFKNDMVNSGLEPLLVDKPSLVCNNLYTSGEFSKSIPEQALVLDTENGLVIITGCSHPGINKMLGEIKSSFGKNIYMVFGGFHLMDKSDKEMEEIIAGMKALGVLKCGATHCTGDRQIEMFRKAFGKNFVELGAGNSLVIN